EYWENQFVTDGEAIEAFEMRILRFDALQEWLIDKAIGHCCQLPHRVPPFDDDGTWVTRGCGRLPLRGYRLRLSGDSRVVWPGLSSRLCCRGARGLPSAGEQISLSAPLCSLQGARDRRETSYGRRGERLDGRWRRDGGIDHGLRKAGTHGWRLLR